MKPINTPKECVAEGAILFMGTEAGRCMRDYLWLLAEHGYTPDGASGLTLLHFDHSQPEGDEEIEAADRRLSESSISVGNTILARFPNRAIVEELEARGRLHHVLPELLRNPGVAGDNLGTGSHPRVGSLLFEAVRDPLEKRLGRALRNTRAYSRVWDRIMRGETKRQRGDQVQVFVVLSGVGGTGTGALPGCLASIRKVADDLGVEVRVMVILLGLGTILPANVTQARRNQERILVHLLAQATGSYSDLFFSTDFGHGEAPLSVVLLTNCNAHGEISSLAALRQMTAQMLILLTRTPAGERFRERQIDLENGWETDRFGAPCCASTASLSVFHADRRKALAYCADRLAEHVCTALVQTGSREELTNLVLGLVRRHQLVESDEESIAADCLSRPPKLGGGSAVHSATLTFKNRAGDAQGWPRFLSVERSWQFVTQRYIPETLLPVIRERAREWVENVRRALQDEERRVLRGKHGPGNLAAILRAFLSLLGRFDTANKQKTDVLSQGLRARLERIEEMRRWGDRMRRSWRIVRWAQPITVRQMAQNLEMDGEDAIAAQVEIEVRQVLASEVYPALQDAVSEMLSRAASLAEQIRAVGNACGQESQRLLNASSLATAPVGIELVNGEFLRAFFDQAIREAGGIEEAETRTLDRLLAERQSAETLLERPFEKLRETIRNLCEPVFYEAVAKLDAESLLKRSAGTPERMSEFVRQVIHESAGRVRAAGGLGAEVKWLKMIAVSEPSRFEWLVRLANEIDPEQGEWSLASNGGDPDAICFFQYRAGISLSNVIHSLAADSPDRDVRTAAQQGPDPVSALLPPPRPSPLDVDMALLKAACAGALETAEGDGIYLLIGGDRRLLGPSWDEARQQLRRSHGDLVAVHSLFAQAIFATRDGPSLDGRRLQSLGVDPAAITAVLAEAAELRRYARRPPAMNR